MPAMRTIRQRLLGDQILLLLLLGGGIMATTFFGARGASDGFYEAVDGADMEFGKDRIGDLLRQHRRAGAAEILAALRAALREFTGDAPLDDDRTAVIVKRTG